MNAPVRETATRERPSLDQVRAWLDEVPDPEIPVISVVELGIVRGLAWDGEALRVVLTPTYSGCPATEAIREDVVRALQARGIAAVEVELQLAPAWTTDWLDAATREKLRAWGIAPPLPRIAAVDDGRRTIPIVGLQPAAPAVPCPRCGSTHTHLTSAFGSTPCKSLHVCDDCLEPFDHFKCH